MALFGKQRLGIDLGTANTIIYIENKGIALREPSIIAINSETKEVVAYGKEAAALVGRTSDKYETIHPIQDGVIADFSLTKQLLASSRRPSTAVYLSLRWSFQCLAIFPRLSAVPLWTPSRT